MSRYRCLVQINDVQYSTALTVLTAERGSSQFWRLDFSHRFNFVSTLVGDSKSKSSVVLHALCYCRLTTASSWRKPTEMGLFEIWPDVFYHQTPMYCTLLHLLLNGTCRYAYMFSMLPAATVQYHVVHCSSDSTWKVCRKKKIKL